MKEFQILTWSTYGDKPNKTFVTVAILEPVGKIQKRTEYQFEVFGRFESITNEFLEAVRLELDDGQLL
jgi:hypothetical protein